MQLPEKFSALQFGNYRQYLIGQLISIAGTWMQRMAMVWLIYSITDSALMVGAVAFVTGIVKVISGPIAGAFADMFERKKLLIWIEFYCMLPALAFAGLYFTDRLQLWHFFVLAALQGAGAAAEIIGRHAVAGDLVPKEHLISALNVNSSFNNLGKILGPLIGGFVLYRYGEGMCFLLNAISFIAVITSLLLMKLEKANPKPGGNVIKKIKEAASYIRGQPKLLGLISIVGFLYAMGSPMITVLTVYTKVLFVSDSNVFSYMMTAGATGGLMGALFLDQILKSLGLLQRIGIFIGGLGLAWVGIGFSISVPVAIASSFFIGFFYLGMWPIINTTIQGSCDDSIRGRVVSFTQIVIFTSIPVSDLAMGFLIDQQTAPLAALTWGAMCFGVGSALLILSSLTSKSTESSFNFFKGAAIFATVFIFSLMFLKSLPQVGLPPLKIATTLPKFRVATVQKGVFPRTIKIQGETRPLNSTHIYPKISGFISELNVNIGEVVKKGQVLAVLDLPEVSRELEVALSQEKIALDYLERLSKMKSHKGISLDLELEKSKSAVAVAQAHRQRLELKLQEAQVIAPYDGKVTARFVEAGTYAGNELSPRPQPIVTLTRQDKLRVYVYVDQKNAAKLLVGQSATIRLPDNSNVSIESKIERTAGELEPKSKTLLTELIIDNEKELFLSNSVVDVEFKIPGEPAIQIPSRAVRSVAGENFVTVVDPYNIIHRRKIKISSVDGENTFIAHGVKAGETVALGAESFDDGERILPRSETLIIGFLSVGKDEPVIFSTLRKSLAAMGYIDGKNMQILDESRVEDYHLLPYALERIKEKNVDIIVTFGSSATRVALRNTGGTIPIVYSAGLDLVTEGFANSFEKPGENITGVRSRTFEMGPSRLRTLREILPEVSGVTVLYTIRSEAKAAKELKHFSKWLNLDFASAPVGQIQDLQWIMNRAITEHPKNVMVIMPSTILTAHIDEIMETLKKHKIASIGASEQWARKGALFGLGPKVDRVGEWVASDIDRIFKGEFPGNIPIEETLEPELIINQNVARSLDIVVPNAILERAEKIIGDQETTIRAPAEKSE